MDQQPFFTVVVPTYNHAKFLPATLDSLIAQTFPNWEAVVVNDGSVDDTPLVMADYVRREPRIIPVHKSNGGVASALNEGIRKARGEWILWLSSDDLFEPIKMAVTAEAIARDTSARFFYSHYSLYEEETGKVLRYETAKFPRSLQVIQFLDENYINGISIAVHRSVFDTVGLFDSSYGYAQDVDLWMRIAARYDLRRIERWMSISRVHAGQGTSDFPEAGKLDCARMSIALLNGHGFDALFPGLDWVDPAQATGALQAALRIAVKPTASVNLCGGPPALLERILEWLSRKCPPDLRASLSGSLAELRDTARRAGLPERICAALARLPDPGRNPFTYIPRDPVARIAMWDGQPYPGRPAVERYLSLLEKMGVVIPGRGPKKGELLNISAEDLKAADPLVSVIIPTFNRPEMLAEAVKSVLRQTYRNVEAVVINDGGQGVEALLEMFPPGDRERIVYLSNGTNLERSASRNRGIVVARGKYIAYLDDDDVYYPDHVETLVRHLEATDDRFAYTDARRSHYRNKDGRLIITGQDVPYSVDFDFDRILVGNFVPILCWMHERSCIDEVGAFDETLSTHEDWDLLIRMSRKYAMRHIPNVTCEFSWRTDGSSTTSGNRPDFLKTTLAIYAKYSKWVAGMPALQAQRVEYLRNAFGFIGHEKEKAEGPADAEDPAATGRALKKEKRYVKAIEAFRHARAGGDLSVLADIGDCLAQEGKLDEAGSAYREAITENPRDTRALTGLGILLLVEGCPGQAAERFSTALDVDGRDAIALCGMGLARKAEGAVGQAFGWFVKSLDADPVNIAAIHELTKAAYELGRFSEAEESVRGYLMYRPVDSNILFSLAGILHKTGKHGEALQILDRLAIVDAGYDGAAELRSRVEEVAGGARSDTASGGIRVNAGSTAGSGANPQVRGTGEGADRFAVSIVIPVFNKVEYTRKCLYALAKNTSPRISFETIIVDNASTDGTREFLRGVPGDVVVVGNDCNLGFAIACNQGARLARGRELVFLNNDTEPMPGWLEALLSASRRHHAGICGAKLLYPNGTIQHAGVAIGPGKTGYHIFNGFSADEPAVNRCREFQAVTAACMLVSKSLFLELGGFDEAYRNGYEDVDFCLRARKNGHRVLYVPESVVIHHEETTEGRKTHEQRNYSIFHDRWDATIEIDDDRIYAEEGMRRVALPDGRWTLLRDSPVHPPVSGSPKSADWGGKPVQEDRPDAKEPASRGRALKKEKRYAEAIEAFRQARTGGDLSVLAEIGDCLAQEGKLDDARSAFGEAIAANPLDPRAMAGLGVLDLVKGNHARAVEWFTSVLETDERDATALCGMGLTRKAGGGTGEAFGWFCRALDADPVNVTALHELVKAAHELGRLEEAERYLSTYLQYKPADPHILFSLSGVLYKAGKFEEASDTIEKLRLFSPTYIGAAELEERIATEGAGVRSSA